MESNGEAMAGNFNYPYFTEYLDMLLLGPFIFLMSFDKFYNPLLMKVIGGFIMFLMGLLIFWGIHGSKSNGNLQSAPSSNAPPPPGQNKKFQFYPKCGNKASDVGLTQPPWADPVTWMG